MNTPITHFEFRVTDTFGRLVGMGTIQREYMEHLMGGASVHVRCDYPYPSEPEKQGLFYYNVDMKPATEATEATES